MAMRLSGLVSGMDTESIIRELMNAERLKTRKVENKITTTEWKQEKWSALNSKIYSFYTDQLSKLRMAGSFSVKKASSSNENKVEVTAGTNAPEGTHLIKVERLASSQFVTGNKIGENVNSKTRLVDLNFNASEGTSIKIKAGEKEVTLDVRENTTIGDFVNALKSAGLNASYDTGQQRFFISSKTSGEKSAFEITTSSSLQGQKRSEIQNFLGYDSLSSANKSKVNSYLTEYLNENLTGDDRKVITSKLIETSYQNIKTKAMDEYITNKRESLEAGLEEGETLDDEVLKSIKKEAEDKFEAEFQAWKNGEAEDGNVFLAAEQELFTELELYYSASNNQTTQSGSLADLGLGEIKKNAAGEVEMDGSTDLVVQAADAKIVYNGAELTGSSNNFSANGLTFTLKGVTGDDEVISMSVSNNAEAVYDMVKDFVNAYNELLLDMNEAYNAASSRGYDPLTDEERDAMTDDQIDKWETKIKDSLLRRDNTLGNLISSFRTALSGSVNVDGKSYSLGSFGIASKDYTEKGALHIDGDEDDSLTSGLTNKLMEALNSNPESVMTVMNKLADNLYGSLMDKMKTSSLSSALTVYNDKEMSKTLTNYKDDLKALEKKLTAIEDRYYKQFAAMETAMAKLNSQSSALASMLGMNVQG